MTRFSVLCLACIGLLLLSVPVCASSSPITRTLSTIEPSGGDEFTVTLSIRDIAIGGIVESLPAGYVFVGTTHPASRILLRGQTIAFAVLNETEISYTVRAPATGSGEITGRWEDLAGDETGTVPASHVAVDGIDTPGEAAGAKPAGTNAQAGSPSGILAAAAAVLIGACLLAVRRDDR
ncbi:hypothetical protein FGU65_04005 [Methanoculleus sp. FWC-SCC1]|uniref:PGF-CTERM protein n=1 Tax=Methanoculleus frigidifontis TaxID=2584085 RepID=A0ABT8M818_9EURY|nr:hypothetical protein [Methanoculleus sp. FWC-SCC1]MDN7024061.1 hypothetical protein [Methanoculleus sp. FWC-SCC1]